MRVWGPAGDRGAMEWWPGEDVVDFVSIAIFALPGKNITDPKKQEPFRAIYERKFRRIHFAGKPVLVTEFGVKGPEDFKRQWLYGAAGVIEKHKEISGVSYFNLADNPEVWGDIPAPDWSITRATFEKFVEKLSDQ
jgi:beta-mannanase